MLRDWSSDAMPPLDAEHGRTTEISQILWWKPMARLFAHNLPSVGGLPDEKTLCCFGCHFHISAWRLVKNKRFAGRLLRHGEPNVSKFSLGQP